MLGIELDRIGPGMALGLLVTGTVDISPSAGAI
jgi:hypothetical protein